MIHKATSCPSPTLQLMRCSSYITKERTIKLFFGDSLTIKVGRKAGYYSAEKRNSQSVAVNATDAFFYTRVLERYKYSLHSLC